MAALAGLATVIVLVRYMDVSNYAAYTALSGLIAFAGVVSGLGLERVMTRYVPEGRISCSSTSLSAFVWKMTALRSLIVLVTVLVIASLWPVMMQLFKDVHLQEFPIALAAFIIGEALFQHFSVIFQALLHQKALTRIMIVQWAGRLIVLVAVVYEHHALTLNTVLWAMAVPEVLSVLLFVVVTYRLLDDLKTDMKSHSEMDGPWPPWRDVYEAAKHNYQYQLLGSPPQSYVVKMLVVFFLPAHVVAAYGFFTSLAERFRQYIPLHLFYNLIEPVLIGQYLQRKEFDQLNARAQWLYKSNLLVLLPVIIALLVMGSDITGLITNGKYTDMNWLLILVLMQLTIGSHVNLLQMVSNAVSKSEALSTGAFCSLTVLLIFWIIVIPVQPYLIFVGPLLHSLSNNNFIIWALKRAGFSYKLHIPSLCLLLVSSAMAWLAGEGMRYVFVSLSTPLILNIVLSGLLILAVFVFLAWRLGGIQQDEISQLKQFLKK